MTRPVFWPTCQTASLPPLTVQISHQRGQWVLLVFDDRHRSVTMYDSLDTDARLLGARVVGVVHEKQQTLTAAFQRDQTRVALKWER